MINNFENIITHSLTFIQDDYTELWVIANKVQEENPNLIFTELVEATKEVVRELIEKHHVFLLNEETQMPMKLDKDQILKLVENKFKTLGRIPNIGDGMWFAV